MNEFLRTRIANLLISASIEADPIKCMVYYVLVQEYKLILEFKTTLQRMEKNDL